MPRQDDSNICGEIILYRRVPLGDDHVKWDSAGTPVLTSQNFKDRLEELSVNMAHETTPADVLAGHEGYGLAQITAGSVRVASDTRDPSVGR